jgi:RNA polymerase-binding protein DksA
MSTQQEIEQSLRARLEELNARITRIDEDLRQPLNPDFAEQATDMEADEAMEALEQSSRAEVDQILAALARMEEGSYGICASCGVDIPAARLKAVPYATECIDCASSR